MQVLRFEVALYMVRLQPGPARKSAHVKPYLEGTTGLVCVGFQTAQPVGQDEVWPLVRCYRVNLFYIFAAATSFSAL
jgi:hypothetical protein